MIRETPFHPRTADLNQTGLWSHWSGYLSAEKYTSSEKFEYFAIRNSVGLFDTSPLYKYRISGSDAERFLAGVLTRDIRKCQVGQAQYTLWCNHDGYVLEDGVVLRQAADNYLLTTARANLSYFQDLIGPLRVAIDDVSAAYAALAVQGPNSRRALADLDAGVEGIGYFRLGQLKLGNTAVMVSRTGYTGDLGYEVWVDADQALTLWDDIYEAAIRHGGVPVGQAALLTARIEAGLVLIDVDFESARFAWNDDQRLTPIELGMGWMLRGLDRDDRAFIGRRSIERELRDGHSRWAAAGIMVDWNDWNRAYAERGIIPPMDHTPDVQGRMIYDDDMSQIGYLTSFVYSPVLQRHIGMGRVLPTHASPGTAVRVEVTIDHRYDSVAASVVRMPFFDPARKKA